MLEGQEPEEQDISQKRLIPTGINVPPTGVYLEELEHFIRCLAEDRDSDLVKEEEVAGVLSILEEMNREL